MFDRLGDTRAASTTWGMIPVEHTIAELKWWRSCNASPTAVSSPETINSIAGLVSDKSAGLTW